MKIIYIVLLLIPPIRVNVLNVNKDTFLIIILFANNVNVGKDNSIMEVFLILVVVPIAILNVRIALFKKIIVLNVKPIKTEICLIFLSVDVIQDFLKNLIKTKISAYLVKLNVGNVSTNQIIVLFVPLLQIENKYLLYVNVRLDSMKIYFKIKEIV
jgi:hypothetical protein